MSETELATTPILRKPFSGLHIVANLRCSKIVLLENCKPLQLYLNQLISKHQLQKVGEAYHSFAGGGYTAVIALTESHLSIHTWPEHHYITFDIFISNYLKDNTRVTQQVYEEIKDYFDAEVVFEKRIDR
jgi:S-adenosylmethionine decarboxylase